MSKLDSHGVFWLPEDIEHQFAGKLINANGDIILSTVAKHAPLDGSGKSLFGSFLVASFIRTKAAG
ncbi:MAG: hypothetical protein ABI147_01670 [Acidobacteriaceae bacterium]